MIVGRSCSLCGDKLSSLHVTNAVSIKAAIAAYQLDWLVCSSCVRAIHGTLTSIQAEISTKRREAEAAKPGVT